MEDLTAEVVGRLLALQDDFTTGQVQARMLTTWGDRATSKEAAQKLITTLVDWEVLRSTKTKGHFLLARKMTASIPELQLWLLEVLLVASDSDEIEAQQLLRLPESFPFTISVGVADLRKSQGFNIYRQGLDMDMVAVPKVRVPPILKPQSKPTPNPAPAPPPESPETLVADIPIGGWALLPVASLESIPNTRMTEEPPDSNTVNQALNLLQRFNTDRQLLKSTAYSDGGLSMLFARLERAAMNQAEHGESTLSRYAIWANTVRDHFSEAIRLVRESGDPAESGVTCQESGVGEAVRLLALAHNSLSAFAELQALFDPMETVSPEIQVQDLTATITLLKPADGVQKPVSKSKAVAANLISPPSDAEIAKLAGLKALSVRQPHAEAILRGIKTEDVRATATKFRGRVLIYASLGRDPASDEAGLMHGYGIDDVAIDDLPRGVLIGTVELHDSDGCKWYLRNPLRLPSLVKPIKQPKPVWFKPF